MRRFEVDVTFILLVKPRQSPESAGKIYLISCHNRGRDKIFLKLIVWRKLLKDVGNLFLFLKEFYNLL